MAKRYVHINKLLTNTVSHSLSAVSKSINYSVKSLFNHTTDTVTNINEKNKRLIVNIYNNNDQATKKDWEKISSDYKTIGNDMRKAIANYEQR